MYVSLQFTVVLSRRAVIKWIDVLYKSAGPFYTVSQKKHVTAFSIITLTISVRLQKFLA